MEVASLKRPSPPATTTSHLPQQQQQQSLSSFSCLSPVRGCFGLGLAGWPVASGTAPGRKASIFLCASPGHPQLCCHTFTADFPLHSTAAPWLCCTPLRSLLGGVRVCVCVCACVCVLDMVLSSRYARVVGAWTGRQRLAGTPSLHIKHHSVWVSGCGKGFGIHPEPLLVLPSLTAAPWVSHPTAPA